MHVPFVIFIVVVYMLFFFCTEGL